MKFEDAKVVPANGVVGPTLEIYYQKVRIIKVEGLVIHSVDGSANAWFVNAWKHVGQHKDHVLQFYNKKEVTTEKGDYTIHRYIVGTQDEIDITLGGEELPDTELATDNTGRVFIQVFCDQNFRNQFMFSFDHENPTEEEIKEVAFLGYASDLLTSFQDCNVVPKYDMDLWTFEYNYENCISDKTEIRDGYRINVTNKK